MSEQLVIQASDESLPTENEVSGKILAYLQHRADELHNLPTNAVGKKRGKGYTSIVLLSFLVCRVCLRGQNCYISVGGQFSSLLSNDFYIVRYIKDDKFIKIAIQSCLTITQVLEPLGNIFDRLVDSIPKDFDCCSKYMECSDAKHCINLDRNLALRCGYKKILRSGRIFFGNNRNIK